MPPDAEKIKITISSTSLLVCSNSRQLEVKPSHYRRWEPKTARETHFWCTKLRYFVVNCYKPLKYGLFLIKHTISEQFLKIVALVDDTIFSSCLSGRSSLHSKTLFFYFLSNIRTNYAPLAMVLMNIALFRSNYRVFLDTGECYCPNNRLCSVTTMLHFQRIATITPQQLTQPTQLTMTKIMSGWGKHCNWIQGNCPISHREALLVYLQLCYFENAEGGFLRKLSF